MSIKTVKTTRYVDDKRGFEYTFEPIEDSISIEKTAGGYEARYLVRDDMQTDSPDECDDESLFLVNYHRDFDVRRDKLITEQDVENWYRQEFDDYGDDGKFPFDADYWIFALACYSHSGVCLFLKDYRPDTLYLQHEAWDTSHVGAVLVSKKEWPNQAKAAEAAVSLVKAWNQYLSGDVYGIVKETYDKDKQQLDQESCWGFYGYEEALADLKTGI
jgi:hypothetical protein